MKSENEDTAVKAGTASTDQTCEKAKRHAGKSDAGFPWKTAIASAVSAIALILILLGFGVSMGVETRFALPHSTMYESVLDLTDLSSVAVAGLLSDGLPKLLTWEAFFKFYDQRWPLIALAMGAWLLLTMILYLIERHPQKKPRIHVIRHRPSPAATKRKRGWLGFLLLGLIWPVMPLFSFVMAAVVICSLSLIGIVPVLGMTAAELHIDTWVIQPKRCFPSMNRVDRLAYMALKEKSEKAKAVESEQRDMKNSRESVATCVVVMKDGKPLGMGRVVVSSSKSIVLYNPISGFADRIPVNDAVVRAVSSLEGDIPWPTFDKAVTAPAEMHTPSGSELTMTHLPMPDK